MKVNFHKSFFKDYRKLPNGVCKKFQSRLSIFKINQYHVILNNHKLSGKYGGYYSINITGDYRAIYEKNSETEISFDRIGTHSQLYG